MSESKNHPGRRRSHRARMVQPKQHDTYARKRKTSDAKVCDRCDVVFHAGRWYWGSPPLTDSSGGLCPACERIRDRYPAGTIRIPGELLERREEVLALIDNAAKAEMAEHPLERLMGIEEEADGGLSVTTTGIHAARRIVSRLERCFNRKARIRYPAEQNLLHADWKP